MVICTRGSSNEREYAMSDKYRPSLTDEMKRRGGIGDHTDSCRCEKCRAIYNDGAELVLCDETGSVPEYWSEGADDSFADFDDEW